MPQNNTVPMLSPDGQAGDIPHDRVKDALAAGGTLGVDVLDPHGNAGLVPMSRIHEVINAGGSLKPPTFAPTISTSVPQDNDVMTTAGRLMNNLPYAPDLVDKAVGVAKGIGSSLDTLNNVYQASQGNVAPMMTSTSASLLQPSNAGESLGKATENAGEYMLPAAAEKLAATVATSGIPRMLARTIASGASNAAVSALHGDTTPGQLGTSAALGAAGPVVEGVGNAAAASVPRWLISRAVPTLTKDASMGKDAAQGIVDNGLVAASRDALRSKVGDALNAAQGQLKSAISKATAYGRTVDVTPAMKTLDDAIAAAAGDQSLMDALNTIKDKVTNVYMPSPYDGGRTSLVTGQRNLTRLTPDEAQTLKSDVANTVSNWGTTGNVNPVGAAKRTLRSDIDDAIASVVPETQDINGNISNLMAAKRSLLRPAITWGTTARDVFAGGPVVTALHLAGLNVPAAAVGATLAGTRFVPVATSLGQGFNALSRNAGTLYDAGRSVGQGALDANNDVDGNNTPSALNNALFNMALLGKVTGRGK